MILLNGEEVIFEKFPNGETRLVEDSIFDNLYMGGYNRLVFKYSDDADLIKLLFVKKYLDSQKENKISLYITYMPYSRMDRIEGDSAFTLKYITEFINNLNFYTVTIIEPHSEVTPALLDRCKVFYHNEAMLKTVMHRVGFGEDDYVVFPDITANKRYSKFVNSKTLTGLKNRDFETGKIKDLQIVGDVTSKDFKAILIDDLSSYGGTFLMTARKLKELGAKEIYLIVSHCEDSIFKGDVFTSGLIDKVFTTDTILNKDMENEKIEIFEVVKFIK